MFTYMLDDQNEVNNSLKIKKTASHIPSCIFHMCLITIVA